MLMNELSQDQLKQEITVTLPLGVVMKLNAAQTSAAPVIAAGLSSLRDLPAIGAEYQGGKYAGLTIDENGLPAALVLLPGEFSGDHEACTKLAVEHGGALPSRFDALVLLKNLKAEFKDAYYWCAERHAGDAASAWYQTFGNGFQLWFPRSYEYPGVAVRRIPIQ
jgi:hypothetical protein